MNISILRKNILLILTSLLLTLSVIMLFSLHSLSPKLATADVTGSDIEVWIRATTNAASCTLTEDTNTSDGDGNNISAVTQDDAADTFSFNSVTISTSTLVDIAAAGGWIFSNPYYIVHVEGASTAEVLTSNKYTMTKNGAPSVNKTLTLTSLTSPVDAADGARTTTNPGRSSIDLLTTPTSTTGTLETTAVGAEVAYNAWAARVNLTAAAASGLATMHDKCSF